MHTPRDTSTRCASVWWWWLFLLMLFSQTHQQTPSRTKRPLRNRHICSLLIFRCKSPNIPDPCTDDGQKCVDVQHNPNATSERGCVYICEPVKPITQENASTDLIGLFNESNNVNGTFTTPTTPGTVTTTSDWRSNPAFCAGNFVCRNGGRCIKKQRENETKISHGCECPQNFTGTFCHKKCTKKCKNNGTCVLNDNNEKCRCMRGYTGQECETIKEGVVKKADIWYIPVLIIFAFLILCVLVIFIVQKLRWRSLLVTKLFHFFQPYEDDDGKEFDAFISFRATNADYTQSEDEKFVLRVLQPILENEYQYKMCVHYRDFPPGETIANNIMWAVENSRRTILILSPLYVESEWARLEYQKAQQEMLQLRHKIIPIIFRDISDTHIEDPTLKHILSSVTYINYPSASDEREHSKFWKMLQLALPKKRSSESETSSTSSHPPLALSSSQTLVSQESWQSGRTDITDISEDIEMEEVPCNNHVTVDVNELNKIRIKTSKIEDPNKKLTLNNNADKFISMLESVS